MAEKSYHLKSGNAVYETGVGPVVIVIPGGPGLSSQWYQDALHPLAKTNRLIFWDYGGVGNSAARTVHSFANDYADLLNLVETLGESKVCLLAHSYGGCLAQKFAIDHGEKLNALILIGTSPNFMPVLSTLPQRKAKILTADEQAEVAAIFTRFQAGTANIEDNYNFSKIESRCQLHNPSEQLSNQFAERCGLKLDVLLQNQDWMSSDFTNALPSIQIPTLVVTSQDDIIIPPSFSNAFHAIPNSKFVLIPGSGHWPFIEAPQLFFQYCSGFLQTI